MQGIDEVWARLAAIYALTIYLPMSRLARVLRSLSRRVRGKTPDAETLLPQVAWSELLERRSIQLAEIDRCYGNTNLSELAILAQAAAHVAPGSEIVEIGTFDGRTSLNFAMNAPPDTSVITLDLPDHHATAFAIEAAEQLLVEKPASGERLQRCRPAWRSAAARVRQVFGDSATYDWSPHLGCAGLVFVDGSHAYDYARKDSDTAFRLVRAGGAVIWHDYGVWHGVTRTLEELEADRKLGLRHIRGTSLVIWQAPTADLSGKGSAVPAGLVPPDHLHVAPVETGAVLADRALDRRPLKT